MIHIRNGFLYLKMLRQSLKIRQKDLAEICECATSTYCRMENGGIPFDVVPAKKVTDYINSKLDPNIYKPLIMEEIFFINEVTYVKQKEE